MDSAKLEKVNNMFKCSLCKEPFDNPIILPCGNVVCSKDFEKCCVNGKIAKCQFCHKEHVKPMEGFVQMKPLNELMKLESDELWSLLSKLLNMERN